MKKITLIAFSLFSLITTAQDFGIKAGTNIPSFTYDFTDVRSPDDYVKKNNVGFYAGVTADFMLTNQLSLQADLLFNSLSYDTNIIEGTQTSNYLSLPLGLNYHPIEHFKFGVGASVNYLIKSEYESQPNSTIPIGEFNSVKKENNSNNYDDTSFMFHINASYNIFSSVYVDARFNLGLTNDIRYLYA